MAKKLDIMRFWPIAVFVLALAGGAGAQQIQLISHDKRLTHIEDNNSDLKQGQARIDERTKTMQKEQKMIRQDIKAILRELRLANGRQ